MKAAPGAYYGARRSRSHPDQQCEVMPITVPDGCRSGMRSEDDHFLAVAGRLIGFVGIGSQELFVEKRQTPAKRCAGV